MRPAQPRCWWRAPHGRWSRRRTAPLQRGGTQARFGRAYSPQAAARAACEQRHLGAPRQQRRAVRLGRELAPRARERWQAHGWEQAWQRRRVMPDGWWRRRRGERGRRHQQCAQRRLARRGADAWHGSCPLPLVPRDASCVRPAWCSGGAREGGRLTDRAQGEGGLRAESSRPSSGGHGARAWAIGA